MTVVKIQKAKKSCFEVFFSDGTGVLLDKEYCLQKGISVGDTVDDALLKTYIAESDLKRAKSRALYYLSNGDLSQKMLTQKLLMAGFSKESCVLAVERMCQLGYIDDYSLARRMCEVMLEQNISPREAQFKLTKKGIPSEVVRCVMLDYNPDTLEQIKDIIIKKYAQKLKDPNNLNKVFSALVRRGFSFSDIKAALREYTTYSFTED